MINTKKLCLLLTGIILSFHTIAQNKPLPERWTLNECIDYALENNLTVKRNELSVSEKKIGLLQSKANLLPSANVNTSYGKGFGLTKNSNTNIYENLDNSSFSLSGSSNMTIFNGFQLINSIRQNNLYLQGAKLNLETIKNNITLNVVNAFLNVVYNQELLKNANFQLTSTSRQFEQIEKLFNAGAVAELDLFDIKSQMATNEFNIVNAENNLTLAFLQLKQFLQIPANQNFEIEVPIIAVKNVNLTDESTNSIYLTAERTQPQIKRADIAIKSAKIGQKIASGAYYPTLGFAASFSSNYFRIENSPLSIPELVPFNTQLKNNLGKNLGLTLSIPILNGLRTRSNVQRAFLSLQDAEITAKEERNALRQTIEAAYNDAQAAYKAYQAALKKTASIEEVFRVMEEKYKLGSVNSVDYQIASNNLYQSQTDLTQSKYEYIFKLKLLDFYQGNKISLN